MASLPEAREASPEQALFDRLRADPRDERACEALCTLLLQRGQPALARDLLRACAAGEPGALPRGLKGLLSEAERGAERAHGGLQVARRTSRRVRLALGAGCAVLLGGCVLSAAAPLAWPQVVRWRVLRALHDADPRVRLDAAREAIDLGEGRPADAADLYLGALAVLDEDGQAPDALAGAAAGARRIQAGAWQAPTEARARVDAAALRVLSRAVLEGNAEAQLTAAGGLRPTALPADAVVCGRVLVAYRREPRLRPLLLRPLLEVHHAVRPKGWLRSPERPWNELLAGVGALDGSATEAVGARWLAQPELALGVLLEAGSSDDSALVLAAYDTPGLLRWLEPRQRRAPEVLAFLRAGLVARGSGELARVGASLGLPEAARRGVELGRSGRKRWAPGTLARDLAGVSRAELEALLAEAQAAEDTYAADCYELALEHQFSHARAAAGER